MVTRADRGKRRVLTSLVKSKHNYHFVMTFDSLFVNSRFFEALFSFLSSLTVKYK